MNSYDLQISRVRAALLIYQGEGEAHMAACAAYLKVVADGDRALWPEAARTVLDTQRRAKAAADVWAEEMARLNRAYDAELGEALQIPTASGRAALLRASLPIPALAD